MGNWHQPGSFGSQWRTRVLGSSRSRVLGFHLNVSVDIMAMVFIASPNNLLKLLAPVSCRTDESREETDENHT